MDRRRALMGAQEESGGRIPSAYQEVTYIRASTTGYLQTGVVPVINPKLETTIKNPDTSKKDRTVFYLSTAPIAETPSGSIRFAMHNYSNQPDNLNYRYGTSAGNSNYADLKTVPSDWVKISASNVLIVGNTTVKTYAVQDFGSNTAEIVLGTSSAYTTTYLFKSVVIYDGDTKVAEMIPCYRKNDNKIGMYCLVRNEFYPGQGTWYKGADV